MNAARPADAVPLLQRLIRSACVNDGSVESGQEIRNVRVLLDYLGGLDALAAEGVEAEVIEPEPGRGNLIVRLRGTDPEAPSLALVGHLDVVPADPAGWSRDPFAGELVDGEVWGRGALDMLNFTAAMAVAFRILVESGVRPRGDVVLAATADEESGSRFGMGWLVEHRPELVLTDLAITESGGGILLSGGEHPFVTVTTGQKGAASRTVVVRGESGHGSMPYGVRSGAALAAEAVRRLTEHRTRPQPPAEGWAELLGALGFGDELVRRLADPATLDDALAETGEYARLLHALSHMTLAPTIVSAGTKLNVLPGEGRVEVDVRTLPGQGPDDVERELRLALEGLSGSVEIMGGFFSPALETPGDDPLFRAIAAVSGTRHAGARPMPLLTPGGNDARHFLMLGRPCYGFGLFSERMGLAEFRRRFHGDDERVDVASVELCAAAYVDIVRALDAD